MQSPGVLRGPPGTYPVIGGPVVLGIELGSAARKTPVLTPCTSFLTLEIHLKYKDIHGLKVKEWQKM